MAYNWSKMVTITVPVGLNGWLYSGKITINGIATKFPVGVETSLPEPVAAMIQQMIAVEEDNEVQTPDNLHTGSVTIPAGKTLKLEAGAMVEDEAGVLGPGTGGGTSTVVVLEETTLTGEGGQFQLTTPLNAEPEAGKVYKVTYNGTEYECATTLYDGMILLGKVSVMQLPESNEEAPFVIGFVPSEAQEDYGGIYGVVMDLSGASSVTLSVIDTGKSGQTAGINYVVNVDVNGEASSLLGTPDIGLAQILTALKDKKNVVCYATWNGACYILQATGFVESENMAMFSAIVCGPEVDNAMYLQFSSDGVSGKFKTLT